MAKQHVKDHPIFSQMDGMNAFWRAEALIAIAGFSGEERDRVLAGIAIHNIHSKRRRDDASHDLKLATEENTHRKARVFKSDLTELASVLSMLESSEDSRVTSRRENSAHLRLLAEAFIDGFFAETMK